MSRLEQRQANQTEVKAVARRLMQVHGAAGISIRAIAREMDLTPPAIYRYYPSLADLITALIVEAYEALAQAVAQAIQPQHSPVEQLRAFSHYYRHWALNHPTDFQLIYGTPIPGYQAPGDITIPAAARSYGHLLVILQQADQTRQLRPQTLPPGVAVYLESLQRQGYAEFSQQVLYIAPMLWATLHGLVTLELSHHLPSVVGNSDSFYNAALAQALERWLLPP
jgi:AcrR family transcriptional regulator